VVSVGASNKDSIVDSKSLKLNKSFIESIFISTVVSFFGSNEQLLNETVVIAEIFSIFDSFVNSTNEMFIELMIE
jgi:hypothetical protein